MLKHLFYSLLASRHRAAGLKQLRELEKKLISPQSRFAIPFAYRGKGYFKRIDPRQNPFEIEQLYRQVCELTPRRVLEIGTARGGSLYMWVQAASRDATLVSVDLPGGEFGGAYPDCRIPFYQAFARPQQHLHLLRTDSHLHETLHEVRSLFGNQPVDFAFIDGDHTYEGVKQDFNMYGPLVRPGGLIAFHDILPRPDMPDIEVDRFWQEVSSQYESMELVGAEDTGRAIGIGIVVVGKDGVAPV
jgi:predicted O-methyltransferase YrrM